MNAVLNMPVVPTIASSAVLVSLNISVWTGRKLDKQVSAEIDNDKNTRVRAGNYHKNLMAGVKELDDITKFAAETRNWFAYNTLPWGNEGTKIKDVGSLYEFTPELASRQDTFWAFVEAFCATYYTAVQAAQFKLGALFNADEYPPVEEIKAKFGFKYVFYPVPEAGDFRIDIGNDGLRELQAQFNTAKNEAIHTAMRSLWDATRDDLERLSNQLRVELTGDVERLGKHVFPVERKGKLYQSTLDSALARCDMMKSMNLTGDPEMERVRKELRMLLSGVDLVELRKDSAVRLSVKSEIDDLLGKFNF